MKNLILTALILIAGPGALAQTRDEINCGGKNFVRFNLIQDAQPVGLLVYNYSSAQLICPYSMIDAIKKDGIARCLGLWSLDDSPAWVEIRNEGDTLWLRTRTIEAYGSKIVKIKCEIKRGES